MGRLQPLKGELGEASAGGHAPPKPDFTNQEDLVAQAYGKTLHLVGELRGLGKSPGVGIEDGQIEAMLVAEARIPVLLDEGFGLEEDFHRA